MFPVDELNWQHLCPGKNDGVIFDNYWMSKDNQGEEQTCGTLMEQELAKYGNFFSQMSFFTKFGAAWFPEKALIKRQAP